MFAIRAVNWLSAAHARSIAFRSGKGPFWSQDNFPKVLVAVTLTGYALGQGFMGYLRNCDMEYRRKQRELAVLEQTQVVHFATME